MTELQSFSILVDDEYSDCVRGTVYVEARGVLRVAERVVRAARVAPAVGRAHRAHVQRGHHVARHRRLLVDEVPAQPLLPVNNNRQMSNAPQSNNPSQVMWSSGAITLEMIIFNMLKRFQQV